MTEYIGPFMVGFFVGAFATSLVAMIAGFIHFYGKTIDDELAIYKEPQTKEKSNVRKQKKRRSNTARAKNK